MVEKSDKLHMITLSEIRARHASCTKTSDFNEWNTMASDDRGDLLIIVDELCKALSETVDALSGVEQIATPYDGYEDDKKRWMDILEKTEA